MKFSKTFYDLFTCFISFRSILNFIFKWIFYIYVKVGGQLQQKHLVVNSTCALMEIAAQEHAALTIRNTSRKGILNIN